MRVVVALVPGLLAAALALATADGVDLPWLLLGTRLEADATGRVFLLLAALVWTTAAVALGPTLRGGGRNGRLLAFGAVALVGNLGLAVAQDAVSFYTCFSVMSLAAYGLVAARGDREGRRAGAVYIGMAVVAEAALLAGLILGVRAAGDLDLETLRQALADAPERDLVIALLIAGFGVKAGMLGLHVWLPRAYAAAPLPLAAVLAGALTELGVLGWLRVLPIGGAALAGWGAALVATGFAAVAWGLVRGLTRRRATEVLAYSSIGQIGLMTAGVGVALAQPDLAPAAVAAVLLLALHHGIVKGALFIGLGVLAAARPGRPRRAAMAAVALLALALAGAPATSGSAAKEALKVPGEAYGGAMGAALALSATTTALLMWRAILLTTRGGARAERLPGQAPALALAGAVAAVAVLPVLVARWAPFGDAATAAPSVGSAWAALWPIGIAAALAAIAARVPGTAARPPLPGGGLPRPALPPLSAGRAGADALAGALGRGRDAVRARAARAGRLADAAEARMADLAGGALALAALVLAIAVVLR